MRSRKKMKFLGCISSPSVADIRYPYLAHEEFDTAWKKYLRTLELEWLISDFTLKDHSLGFFVRILLYTQFLWSDPNCWLNLAFATRSGYNHLLPLGLRLLIEHFSLNTGLY